MKLFLAGLLLAAGLIVLTFYNIGIVREPGVSRSYTQAQAKGEWFGKQKYGIHHLVVEGTAHQRGQTSGELTKPLLILQEKLMIAQIQEYLPKTWMIHAALAGASIWYQGISSYLEQNHLEEILGTSLSGSPDFNHLASPFTRQIVYLGLHELGQKMGDRGYEGMGCTVLAAAIEKNWIIGRNFDYEAGRIFDSDKIVKWEFPDEGMPYVSVIWAGMVGAVTGVNEAGVYVSINGAGSEDSRRLGTPSSLLVLKILEEAKDVNMALQILKKARVLTTSIFVIADKNGQFIRVEKSPKKMGSLPFRASTAVTNHLVSSVFSHDKTNKDRQLQLTTMAREKRGLELLSKIPNDLTAAEAVPEILKSLRDKGVDSKGLPLHLGNRQAIDSLIATHAVIYDGVRSQLYVSKGPALVGEFLGYDLKQSFATRKPVAVDSLPPDKALTEQQFADFHQYLEAAKTARRMARLSQCSVAMETLKTVPSPWTDHEFYLHALGDVQNCDGKKDDARHSWTKALAANPAYQKTRKQLEEKISR